MTWRRVSVIVGFLLGSAVAFHALSHGEPVVVRRSLGSFPMGVGPWKGQDYPIDPRVLNLLNADDVLLRLYRAPRLDPVILYIAFFQSQRQGQTIHSPKNCLPGSGWEPIQSGREVVQLGDGKSVLLNRYVVENGLDRQLVFYWYQSHGRTIASEYFAKAYMMIDAVQKNRTDGAIVRVSLPMLGDEQAADKLGREYIKQIYPILEEYIPN